jgi:phosphate transport system protein
MFRFKELLELWRSDNLLTQALNDSHAMLESTEEMFTESVKSLRESDSGEMGMDVYKKDQIVNKYEREVRGKVLKHLAITGGAHVIPGLILTSIVIDIERIGDYTKNIKDIALAHPKRLECGTYEDDIQRIERGVADLFKGALPALRRSDKSLASRLIRENWWMLKKSDEVVIELIKEKDPSLGSGNAVTTAMYARFLKRIAAHLINMLTGVVNPFEHIGFHSDEEDE